MKGKKLFAYTKVSIAVILLALVLLYLSEQISLKIFLSVFIGIMLSTLNFAGAITSIKISYKKKGRTAISSYIIGMAIRLPLLIGALIFSLLFLDISDISLIFSVLIFYTFFLIIEIIYLNIETS